MKKIKVSELEGVQLDCWVARADGREVEIIDQQVNPTGPRFYARLKPTGAVWWPSTHWAQGGPIIERERIKLQPTIPTAQTWYASIFKGTTLADGISSRAQADQPLVAAMRAFVASKFGEEVEVLE